MKCGTRFPLAWPCLAFMAAAASAAPIDVANPPQGRFIDEWAEVYLAGGKVGYAHSTIARDGNLIYTNTATKMKIGRVDKAVTIETAESTTETIAGTPISFVSEMKAAVMNTVMKGTFSNGKVAVTSSQFGMEQTRTFEIPSGALMAWGSFRESLLRGFKPGAEYTLEIYAPELRLDAPVTAVTKVGGWEEYAHRGKQLRGQKVTVTLESPMGSMEVVSFVDKGGRPLKATLPAPGLGNVEIITTDQAAALADFIPPEVFMTTAIEVDRKLDPKAVTRIKYRIRASSPGVDLTGLPTTGMQQVTKQAPESVEIVVSRHQHQTREPRAESVRKKSGSRPDVRSPVALSSEELAEYIEPNLMINTADPELIKLAKRAAAGESRPYALADRLRRFVTEYVKTKNLNIGFATASEVCRNREGDCSEHGVLLAALGRLNGLPSQVVVGVAYVRSFGGLTNVFAYHMWTQFLIDEQWVDFDAAMRESDCSPGRIAFATSSLRNTGLADLSLPMLSKIGAIDIEILEVETTRNGGN